MLLLYNCGIATTCTSSTSYYNDSMTIFIMKTNKATQKKLLYETMSEQMVLRSSCVAIQQRCSNNQKFKTFFIIHKLAQELNEKRDFFLK
jgi:hypothetical protein